MSFLRDIYLLLATPSPSRDEMRRMAETNIARQAASRFSRGNVATQMDSFLTKSDLENEREFMKGIKVAK